MISKKIFFLVFLCCGIIATAQKENFNSFYRSGLRKLNTYNYAGALVDFKKAYSKAELSHEEVKILLIISDVYYRQKKYKDAKNWTMRILDIPDLKLKSKISTYRRLINYSLRLKLYDDALDYVKMALRTVDKDQDKAIFIIERAKIYEAQKKYTEAVVALRECIEICENGLPQWQKAQQKLIAVLFKQKKYKQILALIPELGIEEWEDSSRQLINYYAGLCAMRQKKYKLATSWLERIPDKGRSWFIYSKNSQLGSCWKQLREYEKAYKCFEIIYKKTKLQDYYRVNGLYMMADMRYLQKKYQDAKNLCEKVKKSPNASKIQIKRAEKLLERIKK
jgi:tetratricopeptide (TPR) repeat protein